VVDLVEAHFLGKGRRLFAADAARAVHGELRLVVQAGIVAHPVGEFAEGLDVRIDRALEYADRRLIVVAGVDDDRLRVGDQRVPVLRLDIGADNLVGVDVLDTHGDDLFLQPHLHAQEGHFRRAALLVHQA